MNCTVVYSWDMLMGLFYLLLRISLPAYLAKNINPGKDMSQICMFLQPK